MSTTINEQVAQKTSVTVASSANPSLLTDNVTITVTVSNGAPTAIPTGMVTLTDGGVMVGTAGLDANGNAAFTLSTRRLARTRCRQAMPAMHRICLRRLSRSSRR